MGEKDEGCKCSTATARTWLIMFNSVFVILGLAVAGAGGVVLWGRDLVSSYLSDMLDQVSVEGSSLNDLLQTISIVLMLLGVLLMGIGVVGCCGGCCLVRCCLMIYSLVMIKLLVMEITAVIVWFVMRDMIEGRVKDALQTAIDTFYAGDTGTDAVSLGLNFLFVQLDCCGIDNYTDLYSASRWNRSAAGNVSNNSGSSNGSSSSNSSSSSSSTLLTTPYTCCQLDGTFPNVVIPPADVSCAVTPNVTNSYFDKPCYDAFFDYISSYQFIFIIVGVCLVVCEVCSAVSAILLKKHAAKQDRQVSNVPSTPVQKTRIAQDQARF